MSEPPAMNPPSGRDDPRDPAIEALYRAGATETPPEDLDRRILAAAHRAAGARPRDHAARSPLRRWAVPLSVAATLVLSVGLVTTMLREQPQLERSAQSYDAAPDRSAQKSAPGAVARSPEREQAAAERDPPHWLQEIDDRFRRGDADGALRSLRAFRKRHPDHPVPASLRDREKAAEQAVENPESPGRRKH